MPERKPGRIRRVAGKLALVGLSSIAAALMAEGLVRWLAPQQLILLRPDIWRPDDGLGWVQAPNLDTIVNTGERDVRLMTDGDGHRVGPEQWQQATHRFLALGDSYLAALQVEHERTLTSLAEQQLAESLDAPVEIVNAGVGGWGPSHYLLKARREVPRRDYDGVVVFFYLGNDATEERISHFAPREAAVRHDFRWPSPLGRHSIVRDVLQPINDRLETRSHLFQLFKQRLWLVLMRFDLSARRFPDTLLRREASSGRWQASAQTCRMIADEAESHGVPTLFVLLPGISQVDPEIAETTARAVGLDLSEIDPDQPSRLMRQELDRLGLPALDVTPILREAHDAGVEDLYGRVDVHFGPAAHRLVARAIAPRIASLIEEGDSTLR